DRTSAGSSPSPPHHRAPARRRMPDANVERARNRLRGIRDRLKAGTITKDQARAQVQAWKAQADFAHAEHLQRAMMKGLPEEVRQRPKGQRKRRLKVAG
ncbi:MAG: hypothetical protein ACOYJ6_19825, partial [Caulobacterales bacterium]